MNNIYDFPLVNIQQMLNEWTFWLPSIYFAQCDGANGEIKNLSGLINSTLTEHDEKVIRKENERNEMAEEIIDRRNDDILFINRLFNKDDYFKFDDPSSTEDSETKKIDKFFNNVENDDLLSMKLIRKHNKNGDKKMNRKTLNKFHLNILPQQFNLIKEQQFYSVSDSPFDSVPSINLQINILSKFEDSKTRPIIERQLLMNSSQNIHLLMENIPCPTDGLNEMKKEKRNNLLKNESIISEDISSINQLSCLIIDRILFNHSLDENMRENEKFSKFLLNWMKKVIDSPYPNYFFERNGQQTKFSEISCRLGAFNAFIHNIGECEHLFSISDLTINSKLYNNVQRFPLILRKKLVQYQSCDICQYFPAQWIVENSPKLIQQKQIVCDRCITELRMNSTLNSPSIKLFPYFHQ
ncbi:hypothetical protein SNEBB_002467 [Seison nebaliae]|nr:hypothetical protein SNEBB_002467 [Seison nebaliae]